MALSKRITAGVALVVVLLGITVVLGWRGVVMPETVPAAITPMKPSAVTPPLTGGHSPRPDDGTVPPPWAGGVVLPPSLAQPGQIGDRSLGAASSSAVNQRDLQQLEKMQQELTQAMQGGQQPDPKQVEALLNQLKQKHGSTVAGINLDVVIINLKVAQEIQVLALDMQRESAKPGGGDIKKMQAYVEQLTKLQLRLRTDVSAPQTSPTAK